LPRQRRFGVLRVDDQDRCARASKQMHTDNQQYKLIDSNHG
jgi:hypothetical protein